SNSKFGKLSFIGTQRGYQCANESSVRGDRIGSAQQRTLASKESILLFARVPRRSPTGLYEAAKNFLILISFFDQSFRMKLHAQQEGHGGGEFRLQFHGLHQSIAAARTRNKWVRRFANRLMMRAIDSQAALAGDFRDQRTWAQFHIVHAAKRLVYLPMIDGASRLLRDVDDQFPAKRDMQHLMAAANGQHWFLLVKNFRD